MWASPGADVGQSQRRCGPVPAQMGASPGASEGELSCMAGVRPGRSRRLAALYLKGLPQRVRVDAPREEDHGRRCVRSHHKLLQQTPPHWLRSNTTRQAAVRAERRTVRRSEHVGHATHTRKMKPPCGGYPRAPDDRAAWRRDRSLLRRMQSRAVSLSAACGPPPLRRARSAHGVAALPARDGGGTDGCFLHGSAINETFA